MALQREDTITKSHMADETLRSVAIVFFSAGVTHLCVLSSCFRSTEGTPTKNAARIRCQERICAILLARQKKKIEVLRKNDNFKIRERCNSVIGIFRAPASLWQKKQHNVLSLNLSKKEIGVDGRSRFRSVEIPNNFNSKSNMTIRQSINIF